MGKTNPARVDPNNYRCAAHKIREFRMPHLPETIDGIPMPIGPGGSLCNCCCPAPGSKERRQMVRRARRIANKRAIRESIESMED